MPTMSEDSRYEWSEDEFGFGQKVPDASSTHTVMNSAAVPVLEGDHPAPSSESETDMPSLWNPFEAEDADQADEPHHFHDWRCRDCSCPDWRRMGSELRCGRCGGMRFYDAAWNYSMNPEWYDWKQTWKKPDDPWDTPGGERAESEAATYDPTVNPDTLQSTPSMSRRQKKAARLQDKERAQYKDDLHATSQSPSKPLQPPPRSSPSMSSLKAGSSGSDPKRASNWREEMQDAVSSKNDKTKNWTIQQGPSPGVKYRGGTPPSPPLWNSGRDVTIFEPFRSGRAKLRCGASRLLHTFLQTKLLCSCMSPSKARLKKSWNGATFH